MEFGGVWAGEGKELEKRFKGLNGFENKVDSFESSQLDPAPAPDPFESVAATFDPTAAPFCAGELVAEEESDFVVIGAEMGDELTGRVWCRPTAL